MEDIFTSSYFIFPSFLIGNLAPSGGNGVAAAVQQMEATMGGRDTTDGSRDTSRDIILETPLNS